MAYKEVLLRSSESERERSALSEQTDRAEATDRT